MSINFIIYFAIVVKLNILTEFEKIYQKNDGGG